MGRTKPFSLVGLVLTGRALHARGQAGDAVLVPNTVGALLVAITLAMAELGCYSPMDAARTWRMAGAQAFAKQGYQALAFDFKGVGDSRAGSGPRRDWTPTWSPRPRSCGSAAPTASC